jgi:tRNA A37 threonylcarbamoyladenosine modification protein TsaB
MSMYILIDMSVKDSIRIVQCTVEGALIHETVTNGTTVELLAALDTSLSESAHTIADVMGIAVYVGVGSFTSTRIAVTVTNAIVYAKHICACTTPVAAITDLPSIARQLSRAVPGQYISATYSGDPRIGNKS